MAKIEGRIETDRHGRMILNPLASVSHGSFQAKIGYLLGNMMREGRVFTECPISTADGVRAADVAWASAECVEELGEQVCFPRAPEICVEVISPSNTETEIEEKRALYLDAGAKEVWLCDENGKMSFLIGGDNRSARSSQLCPQFPKRVELS